MVVISKLKLVKTAVTNPKKCSSNVNFTKITDWNPEVNPNTSHDRASHSSHLLHSIAKLHCCDPPNSEQTGFGPVTKHRRCPTLAQGHLLAASPLPRTSFPHLHNPVLTSASPIWLFCWASIISGFWVNAEGRRVRAGSHVKVSRDITCYGRPKRFWKLKGERGF